MARERLAYYQMWVSDFDTNENVRGMTDAELGLYVRCLNHAWANDGLPSDPNEISRVIPGRRSDEEFAAMWRRVGRCFVQAIDRPGRLVNPRQEAERAAAESVRDAAQQNARKRWANRPDMPPPSGPDATGKRQQSARNAPALPPHSEGIRETDANPMPTQCYQNQNHNQNNTPPISPPPGKPERPESDPWLEPELIDWYRSIFVGEFPKGTDQALVRRVCTMERLQKFKANTPLWMATDRYKKGCGKNAYWFIESEIFMLPPADSLISGRSENGAGGGKLNQYDEAKRLAREKQQRGAA